MIRFALITLRILIGGLLLVACAPGNGERCNPLRYSDNGAQGDCADGFACVYPTAPNCGVAYCCTTDASGKITDTDPNCQPDPGLLKQCKSLP